MFNWQPLQRIKTEAMSNEEEVLRIAKKLDKMAAKKATVGIFDFIWWLFALCFLSQILNLC